MANLNDIILNRDLRTTRSEYINNNIKNYQSNDESETCENCDKIGKCRRKNYFSKSRNNKSSNYSTKFYNYLIVVTSILILTSTNQSEAKPVKLKREISSQSSCGNTVEGDRVIMSEELMKKRLKEIQTGCNAAISNSNSYIDAYFEKVWNTDRKNHTETWEHTKSDAITSWLFPKGSMNKKYNGNIHEHKMFLNDTNWNLEKIFEYLEDIYERLGRIRLGFDYINQGIKEKESDGSLSREQVDSMNSLFSNASTDIDEVLCQIHGFFEEAVLTADYQPKVIDARPMKLDEINSMENVRLHHWFIYREYEHIMKYADELIEIIIKKNKFN